MEHLETASEGVRLWVAYCQHMGVDDEYHGRFKVTIYRETLCAHSFRLRVKHSVLKASDTLAVGMRTRTGLAPEAFR